MKPTRCPSCHGVDLAHGSFERHGVVFRVSYFQSAEVSAAACLECGVVIPYLDDAALGKVQAWYGKWKSPKASDDET